MSTRPSLPFVLGFAAAAVTAVAVAAACAGPATGPVDPDPWPPTPASFHTTMAVSPVVAFHVPVVV